MISVTTIVMAAAGALHTLELTRQERQRLMGKSDYHYNRGNYDTAVEAALQALLPARAMSEKDRGATEMDTLALAAIYASDRYHARMATLMLEEAKPFITPHHPDIFGEIKDRVTRLIKGYPYGAHGLMKELQPCYQDGKQEFARMMLLLAKEFRGLENGEKKCLSYAKRAAALAVQAADQKEVLLEALYILEERYRVSDQHTEALDCLKRILVLEETREERSEAAVCKCLQRIARIYSQMGRRNEALVITLGLLPSVEKVYGKVHMETQSHLLAIGLLYEKLGKHEQGEPYLRQAAAILEDPYFYATPEVPRCLEMLGDNQVARGNAAAAEALYKQAMSLYLEHLIKKPSALGGLLEKLERLHEENTTVREECSPDEEPHHE